MGVNLKRLIFNSDIPIRIILIRLLSLPMPMNFNDYGYVYNDAKTSEIRILGGEQIKNALNH